MMWSVKAMFEDRRNGVAGVVAGATEQGMALIGLRSTPGWNGHLVDEIVLAVPGGWTAERLTEHLLAWGASSASVTSIDTDRPQAHLEAERRSRLAHPAGTRRSWRQAPAA